MYLCDYCGNETSHEASAVKEHVEAEREKLVCFKTQQKQGRIELLPVRDETKGVGPDPVEELDEGKGEIKKKKAEKIPRVGISQDEANPVALQ